jgi:hypothetical protein
MRLPAKLTPSPAVAVQHAMGVAASAATHAMLLAVKSFVITISS